ncbi:DUF2075 domain-containing protein [Paenibacillus sp. 481]|uniref:DUF2075 domain-containing protein n=1 Tax=Paenibacillus sp. 481 TaxID=2835869 RepID=UPI001E4AA2E9|nr:DUF2075 domain-containing protein [Paenibacillus sp. 481]UHA74684.1 DUF2075 domain-containing protein [Paenibacillus sp. 481]
MQRSYYARSVETFLLEEDSFILGELVKNNPFSLDDLQRNAWISEMKMLKEVLRGFESGHIIFEYTIPRIGKRIDCVLIYSGVIYLLEFKVGEREYHKYAIDQVSDYALDLKNFHQESHNNILVPMVIATKAGKVHNTIAWFEDNICKPILCNSETLHEELVKLSASITNESIDPEKWINSLYMPTPTIIEAAQALYRGHDVSEISRNDAGAKNLNATTHAINKIIDQCKVSNKKAICFVTGVPGAGKTLAGLNIANERHKFDENEHAIFLSGNGPLVDVLQEALARDEFARKNGAITKSQATKNAKAFIQNIHHFRDDALTVEKAPIEKVAIFDEAQRAWNLQQTSKFMQTKRGLSDFEMSEPEFLISVMDRHMDWSVIICLIGGGQEINVGEGGLSEWFTALKEKFPEWDVYVSDQISDYEYTKELKFSELIEGLNYNVLNELHLSVSLRSFRSENVSALVKAVLDADVETAKRLYNDLKSNYPIVLTREITTAKKWVKEKARGTERYGLTASSGAKRLRPFGIWVQNRSDAVNWFLNDDTDVRSSYFLEDTVTEFDIQGLEMDWSIVGWDANLRVENGTFSFYNFTGTRWNKINKAENILYLKNAYRVLLTRARQGLVIFVPNGDDQDVTRKSDFYDGIYHYLKEIGIDEI